MSSKQKMIEIYESFATKLSSKVVNEAVENSAPKIPQLLNDIDIDFVNQFDRKYWAQAIKKRYDMFFHYLVNLDKLRKKVAEHYFPQKLTDAKSIFDAPKFANLVPFVKKREIKNQAEAAAKAEATRMFPAGAEINPTVLKHPIFKDISADERSELRQIIDKINKHYIADTDKEFNNFVVGSENKPRDIQAKAFLKDLGRSLEGSYGKPDGYDLNNPRRMAMSKDGESKESRFVTDGFIFPTKKEIEDAIRTKLKHISRGISIPVDDADNKRLEGHALRKDRVTSDEGTSPLEKQLVQMYKLQARQEFEAKKQADSRFRFKESDIDKRAANLARQKMKSFSDAKELENYLMTEKGISQKDLKGLQNPFPNTKIEEIGDKFKNFIIQRNRAVEIPHKEMDVVDITDGVKNVRKVHNPILNKTIMFRDVKLEHPFERKEDNLTLDTTKTNLSGRGLGEKTFDPILFDRLLERWKALKNPKVPKSAKAGIENILQSHGLTKESSVNQIIDAAKRFYYQEAEPSSYVQGSDVSSTYSHHPLRMSAESKFFNRHHNPSEYDKVTEILFDKGSKYRPSGKTYDTLTLIDKAIKRFLRIKKNDKLGEKLPKMIMQRSFGALKALAQDRVISQLADPRLIMDANLGVTGAPPNYFGNANLIRELVHKEMLRYFRQNLFTGSIRGRGDFVDILDADAEDLACRQGKRSYSTGDCSLNMDIKSLQAMQNSGYAKSTSSVKELKADEMSDDIVSQRRQIHKAMEGVYEMMKSLYVVLKTKAALDKHGPAMLKAERTIKQMEEKFAANPKFKDVKDVSAFNAAKKEIQKYNNEARDEAIYQITQFFENNMSKDSEQFLEALHKDYVTNLNDIRKNPAFLARVSIPPELKGPEDAGAMAVADLKTFQDRFKARRKDSAAAATIDSRFRQAIESSDMSQLVKTFSTAAFEEPSQAAILHDKLTKRLPETEANFFKKMTDKELQEITKKLDSTNTLQNITHNFWNRFHFTTPEFVEADPNTLVDYFSKNLKWLNDKNLILIVQNMLDEFDRTHEHPEEKSRFDSEQFNHPGYIKWKEHVKKARRQKRDALNMGIQELEKRRKYNQFVARITHPERLEKMLSFAREAEQPERKKAGRPKKNV